MHRIEEGLSLRAPPGRPRRVSAALVSSMAAKRKEADLNLNGVEHGGLHDFIEAERLADSVAHGGNPYVHPLPLSASTAKRIGHEVAPDRGAGSFKNASRVNAVLDVHNAISMAAVCGNLQDIHSELLLTFDDLSIELGTKKGARPQVYSAFGAKAALRARALQPAVRKDASQYRVPHVSLASSAAGHLAHCHINISDRRIASMQFYVVGASATFSISYTPQRYDHAELFGLIYHRGLQPFLDRAARALLLPSFQEVDLAAAGAAAQPAAPLSPADEAAAALAMRKAITLDGAYPQVNAIMGAADLASECRAQNTEVVKWAAGASLVQQPADVSPIHRSLHQYYNSASFASRSGGSPSAAMADFLSQVHDKSRLDSASKKTYAGLLSTIENAVNQCVTSNALQDGFRITGLRPFSVPQIFTAFSGFSHLNKPTSDILIDSVPHFTRKVARHGTVSDEHIDSYLTGRGLDMSHFQVRPPDAVPLSDLHPSRQRTTWLNNEAYLADYKRKQADKRAAAAAAAVRTAERKRLAEVRKQEKEQKSAAATAKKTKTAENKEKKRKKAESAAARPPSAKKLREDAVRKTLRCANPDCKAKNTKEDPAQDGWLPCADCAGVWFCGGPVCWCLHSIHRSKHDGIVGFLMSS